MSTLSRCCFANLFALFYNTVPRLPSVESHDWAPSVVKKSHKITTFLTIYLDGISDNADVGLLIVNILLQDLQDPNPDNRANAVTTICSLPILIQSYATQGKELLRGKNVSKNLSLYFEMLDLVIYCCIFYSGVYWSERFESKGSQASCDRLRQGLVALSRLHHRKRSNRQPLHNDPRSRSHGKKLNSLFLIAGI